MQVFRCEPCWMTPAAPYLRCYSHAAPCGGVYCSLTSGASINVTLNDEGHICRFQEEKGGKKKECNYSPHEGLSEASRGHIRRLVIAAGDAAIVPVIS